MEGLDLKPRVFVVHNDGTKNLLPALDFGSLEVILDDRHHSVYVAQPLVDRIKAALRTFTRNDYLLLIGDPVAIAIASAWAVTKNAGEVKVLKWDRQERRYYELQLDMNSPYATAD